MSLLRPQFLNPQTDEGGFGIRVPAFEHRASGGEPMGPVRTLPSAPLTAPSVMTMSITPAPEFFVQDTKPAEAFGDGMARAYVQLPDSLDEPWLRVYAGGPQVPDVPLNALPAGKRYAGARLTSAEFQAATEARNLPVSLWSSIGKVASAATSLLPGGNLVKAGVNLATQALTRPRTPAAPPPTPFLPAAVGGMIPRIGGAINTAAGIGGLIQGARGLIGGGTQQSGGCGCGGSHRDPCTQQKYSSQGAPLATFFGGCCPPGRVLRRVNNGRDVCMKRPRMNVMNPRALARADRRVTGFARQSSRILRSMGFNVSPRKAPKLKGKKRSRR